MSVQTPAPRSLDRAVPAAVGTLVSLVALVLVLLAFVLVPLALLAVGLLGFVLARGRGPRPARVTTAAPRHDGFGAGAR